MPLAGQNGGAVYMYIDSHFKRASLVDCRGSGNKGTANRGCAVDWRSTIGTYGSSSCLTDGAPAF